MRAIKMAAAALVLSGLAVPVQAQTGGPVFEAWGACNSYLKRVRKANVRGSSLLESARWEAAYCEAVAYKQFVIVFPF